MLIKSRRGSHFPRDCARSENIQFKDCQLKDTERLGGRHMKNIWTISC